MLDNLLNDVLELIFEAAAEELSDPANRAQLRRDLTAIASNTTGINLNAPIVSKHWDRFLDSQEETVCGFLTLATSEPPHSVDMASDLIKESVTEKVDGLSAKLKERLAQKAQRSN